MRKIDFSCKHNILLEGDDGSIVPMDEPYFHAQEVYPKTWQILSDGDYSYLLEGDDEALAIDSGYGAGNIREFCQTLTQRPVRRIANTHDHFDHTANNCYFECAYMSEETWPLATIPYPSFEGITFPKDYQVAIVSDGDIIKLKGRDLLALKIPDHAVGSLVFLDSKERILFTGDEFMPMGKQLHGSVERWAGYMEKLLKYRSRFDILLGGGGAINADLVEHNLENALYILTGHEGVPVEPMNFPNFSRIDEKGRTIWRRKLPHPGDGPKNIGEGKEWLRQMEYAGCKIIYDIRRVYENQHIAAKSEE